MRFLLPSYFSSVIMIRNCVSNFFSKSLFFLYLRRRWFKSQSTGLYFVVFLCDSTDRIADFTSSLIYISERCIPKTSTNPRKSNPWYNDDCKEAIKQRKETLSRFCKFPTKDNLNTYRVFRAKARRTIKSSKRKSWRNYVSNLNYKTPIKKFGIW